MRAKVLKKSKGLVVNKAPEVDSKILSFTWNLLPAQCRLDTLEEKQYTVVPMVILTEGVHVGSMGPLYYPKDELSKVPATWNYKPIVVYHPSMNGQQVSACDPVIINSRKVGLMMNTRFEKGKLKAEAWIDVEKADKVDERIMAAVNSGEMMELSTGVFVDVDNEEGEFSGESYIGIARNYRPDHLALLPDQIGACSIADGAGFLRNEAKARNISQDVLEKALRKIGLSVNEISHDDIRMKLLAALRERFSRTVVGDNDMMIWILDVFQNFVIYENGDKLYRLGYTSNDTEVALSDENPVEVERVSEYRTVQNQSKEQVELMNKKKLIDAIVGNAGWVEEDRKTLEGLSETQLKRIHDSVQNTEPKPEGEDKPKPKPEEQKATEPKAENKAENPPTANTKAPEPKVENPPVSVQEYIAQAPREVQEVLNNGLATYNAEKEQIVNTILENEQNTFTKEELDGRPLGELKKMARLMAAKPGSETRVPNYAGMAPTPSTNTATEEPMDLPTLNFERAK